MTKDQIRVIEKRAVRRYKKQMRNKIFLVCMLLFGLFTFVYGPIYVLLFA